jgi:hypothetical protein
MRMRIMSTTMRRREKISGYISHHQCNCCAKRSRQWNCATLVADSEAGVTFVRVRNRQNAETSEQLPSGAIVAARFLSMETIAPRGLWVLSDTCGRFPRKWPTSQ